MRAVFEVSKELGIHEITTFEELVGLQQEWKDLWSRCTDATPFQSPEWLIPFWRHLGDGQLWVLCIRNGFDLVGIAPLVIYTHPDTEVREVFLLGTGVTDYLDVLFDPCQERPASEAFFEYLFAHHTRWDVLDFQQLRPGSCLLQNGPWLTQTNVQEVCPVLPLSGGQRKLQSVPQRMLEKLDYSRRRFARLGGTPIETAERENFPEIFESFMALHTARWQRRGQEGDLADSNLQQFHTEAARGLLDTGCLRLYGLRLNGQIIAALYSFLHQRRAYFYLSGFDPEFAPVSPGTLLIGHAIERAEVEGCIEFDFLRGREAYKYLWGSNGRMNFRRRFFAPQPDARAA